MMFLIWLMVLHFVADFLMQSREMGKKKSSEFKWLLKHLGVQFGVFLIGVFGWSFVRYELIAGYYEPLNVLLLASLIRAVAFSLFNTLIHGVIDWNIWKLYKLSAYMRIKREAAEIKASPEWQAEMGRNWQYWEDHWFYATIGFDQLLHMSTLVVLFCYLLQF